MSGKTVSRVLNNEKYVKPELKERVLTAVKRLNYAPSLEASRLKRNRQQSYQIGLLYDNPTAHYISKLIVGTLDRLEDEGYRLAIECLPSRRAFPDARLEPKLIERTDLDGVIVTPPISDDIDLIERLLESGKLVVRLAPHREKQLTPYVSMDDEQASYEITKHLMAQGRTKIAHITGSGDHGSSSQRAHGFIRALAESGHSAPDDWIVQGNYTFASGIRCADHLLGERAQADRPDAIFAANDEMASAVLYRAQHYGVEVPSDLAVAGFDDIPLATIIEPNITTVRQPLERMAEVAAGLLVDLREGRVLNSTGVQAREVPFSLIVRGSSALD
ncbi:MAG: LacI family DNA-binding transcriptional regulator [Parvularculaceae bacterium]|nr:LacI family DNA-binding transcriptional regulator [Parvularculaceae bacterium]